MGGILYRFVPFACTTTLFVCAMCVRELSGNILLWVTNQPNSIGQAPSYESNILSVKYPLLFVLLEVFFVVFARYRHHFTFKLAYENSVFMLHHFHAFYYPQSSLSSCCIIPLILFEDLACTFFKFPVALSSHEISKQHSQHHFLRTLKSRDKLTYILFHLSM